MGEMAVLCGILVLLAAVGAIVFFVVRASRGTAPQAPYTPAPATAPKSRDLIFFLRFEGVDDEAYVRELIGRHAQIAGAAAAREAALDLVRAAPTATHAFVGPMTSAIAIEQCGCGLSGGVIAAFRVGSTRPLDSVSDDQDLGAVVAELRKIAAWTPDRFAHAQVAQATGVMGGSPTLLSVKKETRPGHQICVYCNQAFLAHDMKCSNCGARPTQ